MDPTQSQYANVIFTSTGNLPEMNIIPQEAAIRKVNRGFIVVIGCQTFVFEKEKDMFAALGEYWKNPAAAQKKYVDAK